MCPPTTTSTRTCVALRDRSLQTTLSQITAPCTVVTAPPAAAATVAPCADAKNAWRTFWTCATTSSGARPVSHVLDTLPPEILCPSSFPEHRITAILTLPKMAAAHVTHQRHRSGVVDYLRWSGTSRAAIVGDVVDLLQFVQKYISKKNETAAADSSSSMGEKRGRKRVCLVLGRPSVPCTQAVMHTILSEWWEPISRDAATCHVCPTARTPVVLVPMISTGGWNALLLCDGGGMYKEKSFPSAEFLALVQQSIFGTNSGGGCGGSGGCHNRDNFVKVVATILQRVLFSAGERHVHVAVCHNTQTQAHVVGLLQKNY